MSSNKHHCCGEQGGSCTAPALGIPQTISLGGHLLCFISTKKGARLEMSVRHLHDPLKRSETFPIYSF